MTIFIEVSRPFQFAPWRFSSPVIMRFGWGWFAVGWLKIPFREFATNRYEWHKKAA